MQSEEFVTSLLLYADTFSCASEGTLLCSVQPTHVAPEHGLDTLFTFLDLKFKLEKFLLHCEVGFRESFWLGLTKSAR